jgi:hypothetical protein
VCGGVSAQSGEYRRGPRGESSPELANGLVAQFVGVSLDRLVIDPPCSVVVPGLHIDSFLSSLIEA